MRNLFRVKINKVVVKIIVMLAASGIFNCYAYAEIAIIVHPSNSVGSLSEDDVKKIFLGKSKKFPGGGKVVVTDHASGASKDEFLAKVISKNPSQFKAYWSRIVFTGKGKAPTTVEESDVVSQVAGNADYIGYVKSNLVNSSVKVVATIK